MKQERFISNQSHLNLHKVFIGTLFSGEGDFKHCVDAIKSQKDVDITFSIISNLPERPAHNTLWSSWNRVKSEHDLFVKVDADTVLLNDQVIKNICDTMLHDKNITGMQCPIYDYFSNDLINGLNCFKPDVIFNNTTDDLYCDRVDSGHKVVIRGNNVPHILRPAANHCCYASELQAFHYGLHRFLKNQHVLMQKVKNAWVESGFDRVRGFALLGARFAEMDFKNSDSFNYTDEKFKKCFDAATDNYEALITNL